MAPEQSNEWIPGQTAIPAPAPPKAKSSDHLSHFYHSSHLVQSGAHFAEGFRQGLGVIPVSLASPFIHSETITRVMTRIWAINLLYFTLAVIVDSIHDTVWGHENPDHPNFKSFFRDGCELILFILVCVPFFINNLIHYMCLANALSKENIPHLDKQGCPPEHSCKKRITPNLALLLSEPLSNTGISLSFILGRIFLADYGFLTKGALLLGVSTLYGSLFIQSRLSLCLEGNREYISQHIFSVIGYGASLMALTEALAFCLKETTGRESPLIYDAIFSLIYGQFILHSSIARLDLPTDSLAFHPFSQVHLYFEAFTQKYKKSLIEALQNKKQTADWHKQALSLLQSKLVHYWTTLNFQSLDTLFQNPSAKLYIELTHPTLLKILDGISEIPDNTGIQLGKRLEKWGKHIGFKSELTDLIRTLWEISKRGYFSADFLDPIRLSIQKAAGVAAVNIVPLPSKNVMVREIDPQTGEDKKVPSHSQKTKIFSEEPSSIVRTPKKQNSVQIFDNYQVASPALTPAK